ncbi:hypothetical protein EAF04_005216 [Stromatinia cepivora]|nr:hypothetical protein EAF04_005216 [Stromatinia cepivora]
MPTEVTLFLLRTHSTLPILRNGPIREPTSSTPSLDRDILGQHARTPAPTRTINEYVITKGVKEHYILNIHEIQAEKESEFSEFVTGIYNANNGRSNRDAFIILGLDPKVGYAIAGETPRTRILICKSLELTTCNKCIQPMCSHRGYPSGFVLCYHQLLKHVGLAVASGAPA